MEEVMIGASALTPETPSAIPRQIRIIRVLFIAALLLLVGIATLGYRNALHSTDDDRWVDHTYEVMLTAERLFSDQRGAAATARGYLLTGNPKFLKAYGSFRDGIAGELATLAALVVDNPDEMARVASLRHDSDVLLQQLADTVALREHAAPRLDPALGGLVDASNRGMASLRGMTAGMEAAEDRLLATRRDQAERSERLTLAVVVTGVTLSLLVLLACLYLLTREIAERRRSAAQIHALNLELAGRNAQLELSNRELEGFSYSISHDLRAPLRAIDGFAQLLRTRYGAALDAEAMRLLDVVRESSHRMATLIDDLLAFSRLGRKPLETKALDMAALVGDCIADVMRAMPERPRILIGPLPDCHGDPGLIRQVWFNLICNAVKYSSRNPGARIEITGRAEGHECIYGVQDNGVGFDMQYYHKLFGVFQRLHRVDEFPGTGVGLAIVMRIVTKHAGRLWADATLGQGAHFMFSLPRTESQA